MADLQAFDLSTVTEGERARLKPRLAQVIERDREVLARIEETRGLARQGLDRVVTGRAVVRGYGARDAQPEAGTRRVG